MIYQSFRFFLTKFFRFQIGKKSFCVISNDCWGAEIYKVLGRQFNTPFIGLMLMSPCYIKMLENPQYYLNLPLRFKEKSKYPAMQLISSGIDFPLGVLGDSDIEIHFLHYRSNIEAKEKWNRRLGRMDWSNLFIKYDCGKDYSDKQIVEKFLNINHPNKLIFGKENFGFKEVILIKNYPQDAVMQFRSCFLSFNPIGWLKGKIFYDNIFQKRIGKLAFKYL